MNIDTQNLPLESVDTDSRPIDITGEQQPLWPSSPQVDSTTQSMSSVGSSHTDLNSIGAVGPLPADVQQWVESTHQELAALLGKEYTLQANMSHQPIGQNAVVKDFLEAKGKVLWESKAPSSGR